MLLGLALSMPVEATRSYGPVKDQDTLWSIATELRPDQRATVQQTMLAIFYKNPQAFANNNINSLMKGAILKAPSSAEARRYQRLKALREARKHNVYWARGAQLPYTVPPPIPKIKERAAPQGSKSVVVKVREREVSRSIPRSTERRIARLQAQLQSVESKNQRLTAELLALQAKQTQSKPSPQLDAQVKKLKLELKELTSVLSQKDNHIKTLQASLKNASETIKSQHADNMRLYDKLKEVSPSSLPASPSSEGKSELKLTTVEAATAAVTGAVAGQAVAEASQASASDSTATKATDQSSQNKDNSGSNEKPPQSVWADQQTSSTTQPSNATTGSAPSVENKNNTSDPKASLSSEPQTNTTVTATDSKPTTKTNAESATVSPAGANANDSNSTTKTNPESSSPSTAVANTSSTNPSAEASTPSSNANNPAIQAVASNTAEAVTKTADQDKTLSSPTNSEIKAPSSAQAIAPLESTNDVKTSNSIPVSQMLAQPNHASSLVEEKANTSSTPLRGVSPLALAVALISLLFILALIWRAFVQHREMRRLEAEEARIAERMRKRLEDNQALMAANALDRRETDLEPNTEIKF
jgi:FimV-like protein